MKEEIKNNAKNRILKKLLEIQIQQKNDKKQQKQQQYIGKIKKLYTHLKETRQRNKTTYINKMKLNGQIGALNRKWNNRKIEQQANELQKAADNNNMKPLWEYQKT